MTVFTQADTQALVEIIEEAARAEIMPRFRKLEPGEVRQKSGPLDLVTQADEAAERRITTALYARFPGCLVVGEEAASSDPTLLAKLGGPQLERHSLIFVVDPVDGTSNFAWGLPLFASMAAAIVNGAVAAAVIHDPVGGDSAVALRGEGAWLQTSQGRTTDLRVAAPVPLAQMTGAMSWRFLPDALAARVAANQTRIAASFTYRCAGHEYRLLAAGHCHYLLYGRLWPWDHAPGWLLHREAGGYSARFDGSAYDPAMHAGGLILAPDRHSWVALREALLEP